MPSHISLVEPFRPECPTWKPIFALVSVWTKSTIRFHASSCSGRYMPVQPGLIRPVSETQTISVITRPAPPSALPPRWTRWKSLGTPSTALYMSIADTTTRFFSSRWRSRNGWNIGGTTSPFPLPQRAARSANQASIRSTNSGSRSRRLS